MDKPIVIDGKPGSIRKGLRPDGGTIVAPSRRAWKPIVRGPALAAALALSACASGQDPRVAVAAGWIAADSAVAAYATAPGATVSNIAAARACENAAWPLVKPVSDSLISKTPVAAAELSAAQDALTALSPCLTSLGVKL